MSELVTHFRVPSANIVGVLDGLISRQGRGELAGGNAAAAATTLGDALLMWRGEPYGEFEQAAFAAGECTALEELRLAAIEDRLQAELPVGAGAALIGEIEGLLSRHPFGSDCGPQLMTAPYRSGRQADALAAYQRARSVLIDEPGIEPGPDLRTIEAKVLAHDDHLLTPASGLGFVCWRVDDVRLRMDR